MSEGAHDSESPRLPSRLRLAGIGRPLQGELRRYAGSLVLPEEREEAPQHALGVGKASPEGAPRGEILVEERQGDPSCRTSGPGRCHGAQRLQIELRVNLRGLGMTMPQDLADVFERGTVAEHPGGEGMP